MKFKAAVTGLLVAMPIAGNYYNLFYHNLYRVFFISNIIFVSSFKDVK